MEALDYGRLPIGRRERCLLPTALGALEFEYDVAVVFGGSPARIEAAMASRIASKRTAMLKAPAAARSSSWRAPRLVRPGGAATRI